MPVLQSLRNILTDKLRSPLARVMKMEEKYDPVKKGHFQRLYDYYVNDQKQIKLYTQGSMKILFKQDTINKMLLPYFNITRRIINRLCVAYKVAAERYIIVPRTVSETESKTEMIPDLGMQKAQDNYQLLLEGSNINSRAKEWHRLSKLLDTVYVQAIWRGDHLEYDVFPPHKLMVKENADNYLLADEVSYDLTTPTGDTQRVFWSIDEHWITDQQGRPVAGRNPWNGVNKYGILPFAILRLREVENHWGEGDTQLVDINEKINILLASLNFNAIMQSHGQAVAINMDVEGQFQTGPDKVITAKNVPGDQTASFAFVSPQPAIDSNVKLIDWMIKTAAMSRGLPAASVSIDETPQSGAAKAIDNIELFEIREDDLEYLRPFEKQLFEVSRVIWNYEQPDKKIAEDAEFGVDFVKPEPPMTRDEEMKYKKALMEFGLWTPVMDAIDEDEGIDEEQALAFVRRNLEIRNELNDQYGLGNIGKILEDDQTVEETESTPGRTEAL